MPGIGFSGVVDYTNVSLGSATRVMGVQPSDVGSFGVSTLQAALSLVFNGVVPFPSSITFTRASTATYYNSAGVLTTAAIDAPRIDYNPTTLACLGLLVEPQATNLILQSQDFSAVNWPVRGTAVVTPNTTIAPDGTLTADTLSGATNVTFSGNNIDQTVTVTAGTIYSTAVYFKSLGATTAQIRFRDSTGAGTSSVLLTPTAAWQRLELPNITATAGATSARIIIGGADGDLAIWGAQCEVGTTCSSYIPTVASQVTRAADVPVMTGTNFSSWYNQPEGTFVFEGDTAAPAATASVMFVANDGTANERNQLSFGANVVSATVTVGGVSQVTGLSEPAASANTVYKVAYAYKANDFAMSVNGSTPDTDTSGSVPTPTQLLIGHRTTWLNGHIRSLTYYNTRLPDSTVQGLSAL